METNGKRLSFIQTGRAKELLQNELTIHNTNLMTSIKCREVTEQLNYLLEKSDYWIYGFARQFYLMELTTGTL